jgi:macrodomain Ter protein organizer (MatP/YcbG family)
MPRKKTIREPSASSLKEMPEVDFSKAKLRRNPYAERIAKTGIEIVVPGEKTRKIVIRSRKGRPGKSKEIGKTVQKSVRFPDDIWNELEKKARAQGKTLHEVLREAILEWLEKAA